MSKSIEKVSANAAVLSLTEIGLGSLLHSFKLPFSGHLVEIRGPDVGVTVGAKIAVPQIIRKEDDDVRGLALARKNASRPKPHAQD